MFRHIWREFAPPGERLFERGDFKYVVLSLLADKPRHGYEVIRALEERFGGFYAPSPGVIYPTLQMLEDMGYVSATQQEGRKVYAITDEGRQFLVTQDDVVQRIWARIGDASRPSGTGELHALMNELKEIGRLLRRGGRQRWLDPNKLRQIRDVVSRARREIEVILASDEPATPASGARTV